MFPVKYIKQSILSLLKDRDKTWALLISSLLMLIVITPLCGWLFQCGCDWPWQGLDSRCNYYQDHANYHCPWCASILVGVLMIGFAVVSGLWFSMREFDFLLKRGSKSAVILRVVLASLVFVFLATVMAGLAANWQDYPLGMGYYVNVK